MAIYKHECPNCRGFYDLGHDTCPRCCCPINLDLGMFKVLKQILENQVKTQETLEQIACYLDSINIRNP